MFSVPDFLDRAKRGAGVDSDYALSKALGVNRANVSNWRLQRVAPDERAIEALCKLSGDDPEHVAACIQSMRAANDDAADLWRRVAARLQKGAARMSVVVALATLLIAGHLEPVQAAALAASSQVGGLYIMLSALLRFAYRICRLKCSFPTVGFRIFPKLVHFPLLRPL